MKLIHHLKNKIILGFVLVFGLFGISTELSDFEIAKNLEIFSNIYRELNTFYADEVDPEYLMEIGVNAMLNSLDPYTTYIPADEVAQFQSSITGKYGGVGASVLKGKEHIIISLPYENAPAQKAGLKVGDRMLEIDGKNVVGASMQEVGTQMRGVPNTDVTIKVARDAVDEPLSFTLTREEIKLTNTPYYGMIEGQTAYIVLNSFSENAGENVAKALTELKAKYQVNGVILDLRGNTGGLLTEAVNVANIFLDKGAMIVKIKGRDKAAQQVFRTLNNPIDKDVPICVLIDKSSASASEIVAGAIQDLDRGIIIGQRSYGKGLVQNTLNLSFGAKLKLTTARYYIPSGRCIQALRYKNGKPEQIADSLQRPYETMGGRSVYAGGGIKPDIFVDNTAFLKIMSTLNKDLYLFDFAAAYELKHKTIAKPSEFQLTDKDFEDFLVFLKEKGYNYKTETELLLEELEVRAKKEAYIAVVQSELDGIRKVLSTSGQEELKRQKRPLMHLLQRYIVLRYYYEKGSIETGIHLDEDINAAQEVLANKASYDQVLKPAK